MGFPETTLGGSRDAFPETVWSRFLAGTAAVDLDGLFRLYWRPVYKFIRTAARGSVEDAKDLTQEFFGYLLEGDVLDAYRADRGRFRVFLKGVLRNFLSHDRRDRSRLKRGGGHAPFSLDVAGLERGFQGVERQRRPERLEVGGRERSALDGVLSEPLDAPAPEVASQAAQEVGHQGRRRSFISRESSS